METLGIGRGKLAGRFDDEEDQSNPHSFRPGRTVPRREAMTEYKTRKTIWGRRRTNWEYKLS